MASAIVNGDAAVLRNIANLLADQNATASLGFSANSSLIKQLNIAAAQLESGGSLPPGLRDNLLTAASQDPRTATVIAFVAMEFGGVSAGTAGLRALAKRVATARGWGGAAGNRTATQADVANHFQQNRKFWSSDPVQFNGNKVYQRNDLIDPNRVDTATGLTNKQLMQQGYAPYGPDGKKINLHHLTQKQDGAIAELTQTLHSQNHGVLHMPNTVPSSINRSQFDRWRRQYWTSRANDF